MFRKLLLSTLVIAAAGASLAAGANPLFQGPFTPAARFAGVGADSAAAQPDRLAMLLAGLGLMGVIARRRYR